MTPNPEIVEAQSSAQADVFFLHPTTLFGSGGWNGNLQDEKLNSRTDSTAILHQASIFNGSCRVFAPRYRQLVYGGFFATDPEALKSVHRASEIAYKDIQAAFAYYMANENKGRPFIIAGHSQGTALAIRLIKEHEVEPKFREQLIAAYIPGWGVRADTFKHIPPCKAADDLHCFASWCSYQWGATPDDPSWYHNAACINPVSWTASAETANASQHAGLVLRNYHRMHTHAVSTQIHGNILWVERPDVPGKWVIQGKNFHIGDFNLFWLDVRNNVAIRVEAFLQNKGG